VMRVSKSPLDGSRLVQPALRASGPAVVILAVLFVLFRNNAFSTYLCLTIIVYAIAAVAQDWLVGRAGQVSVGGAAFMACGAFTTAALARAGVHDFFIAVFASALVGAVAGLIVGLPALRLRGLYLLLSTLAFQYIISFVAEEYQNHTAQGGLIVSPATIFSIRLGQGRSAVVAFTLLGAVVIVLLRNLYRRTPGRCWQAVRESEVAASVIGVPPVAWKLAAFAGSSAITSVAGSLYAMYSGIVSYASFSLALAISLVVMVYVGGPRSFMGPVIGAAFVGLTPWVLQQISAAVPQSSSLAGWLLSDQAIIGSAVYGLALLLVLLYEPGGLTAVAEHVTRLVPGRRQARSGEPRARVREVAQASPESSRPLLAVQDLSVTYSSGAVGVAGLSLSLDRGTAIGIVGRNGAGKSSTLQAIAGFAPQSRVRVEGALRFDGRDLRRLPQTRRTKAGLVLIAERDKVCPSLTVADHIRLVVRDGTRAAEIYERFPLLDKLRNAKAGLLSGGERQLMAIALGWGRAPKVLMIDEVTLGLAPVAIKMVTAALDVVLASGTSLVLVDQDVSPVMRPCRAIYTLDHGQLESVRANRSADPVAGGGTA
jgi:branched-chain amino acid transport system permease protein